jgi:hypothetical protein
VNEVATDQQSQSPTTTTQTTTTKALECIQAEAEEAWVFVLEAESTEEKKGDDHHDLATLTADLCPLESVDQDNMLMIDSGAVINCAPRAVAERAEAEVHKSHNLRITGAGGESIPHHGTADIYFDSGDHRSTTLIKARMEIAGVKKGIISVSQLLQKGYKVSFERSHCKITNAQGFQIPIMELNGQYWIRARPRSPPQTTTTRTTTTTQLMPVAA